MLKMAGIRVHPAARILIGGVVIAIGLLATIVDYLPVRAIIDGTSSALLAGNGGPPISAHGAGALAAWAAAGMLLSMRWFQWAPRPAGRRRPARQAA